MRAMRLSSPAPIELAPLEFVILDDPEPGEGEVRITKKSFGASRTTRAKTRASCSNSPPTFVFIQAFKFSVYRMPTRHCCA
jgi:hypothetical protein